MTKGGMQMKRILGLGMMLIFGWSAANQPVAARAKIRWASRSKGSRSLARL